MPNSTATLLHPDGSINEAAIQASAEAACSKLIGIPRHAECVAGQVAVFRAMAEEEQNRLPLSPAQVEVRALRQQLAALEYEDRITPEIHRRRAALQAQIAEVEARESIGINDNMTALSDARGLLGTAEDLIWALDKGYLETLRPGGIESGYIAALRRQVERAKAGQ